VLDIERGQRPGIAAEPWQTDTCVGGWYFDSRRIYKTANHVIEMLVDIVSKNGNLLLNFTQMPDGSLDEQCPGSSRSWPSGSRRTAKEIYGTRPWVQAAEGPTVPVAGAFKEDAVRWTASDFRFTARGDTVYAFQMVYPCTRVAVLSAFGRATGRTVKAVKLLGFRGEVAWEQHERALVVTLPDEQVVPCVPGLKIEL